LSLYLRTKEFILLTTAYLWKAYRSNDASLNPKDKLVALKLIKECDEAKFALFKEGSSIMNLKALEERLNKIELREVNQ